MPFNQRAGSSRHARFLLPGIALMCMLASPAVLADETASAELPDAEHLQAEGALVREIVLDKRNIFDLSDPEENKWLYRWANRLHIVTRDSVIDTQLLVQPGDKFDPRLLEESERILRANRFLLDAEIEPIRYENGEVDLRVTTHDVWSLTPDLSVSRSGGENRIGIGIEETNLFGRGQLMRLKWIDNVDRTSTQFDFEDTNLGSSRVGTFLRIADNSDGETQFLRVIRPFYALDARWSAGGWLLNDDRRTALYRLGDEAAEYRHERQYLTAFGGWSRGLRNGWARRWSTGVVYDDNVFSEAKEPTLPAVIPEDRKLVYPFLGLEILEDEVGCRCRALVRRRLVDRAVPPVVASRLHDMRLEDLSGLLLRIADRCIAIQDQAGRLPSILCGAAVVRLDQ